MFRIKGKRIASLFMTVILVVLVICENMCITVEAAGKDFNFRESYGDNLQIPLEAFVDEETGNIHVYCNVDYTENTQYQLYTRINDKRNFKYKYSTTDMEMVVEVPKNSEYIDVYVLAIDENGFVKISEIVTFKVEENDKKPVIRDSDNDSIPDGYEVRDLDSDPMKYDTDKDGFDDGYECYILCTSPNKKNKKKNDMDKDGWDDLKEYKNNTNPYLSDTDFDGIIDSKDKNPLINEKGACYDYCEDIYNIPQGCYDINIDVKYNNNIYQGVVNVIDFTVKKYENTGFCAVNIYDRQANVVGTVENNYKAWNVAVCNYEDGTIRRLVNNSNVYEYVYNDDTLVELIKNGENEYIVESNEYKTEVKYANGGTASAEYDSIDGEIYSYTEKGVSEYSIENNKDKKTVKVKDKLKNKSVEYSYNDENVIEQIKYSDGNLIRKDGQSIHFKIANASTDVNYVMGDDENELITEWNENVRSKEIIDYYTMEINQSSKNGNVFTSSYARTDEGFIVVRNNGDEYIYKLNDDHSVSQVMKNGKLYVTYKYDNIQQLVEETYNDSGLRLVYEYDGRGNITGISYYDKSGALLDEIEYLYDSNTEKLNSINGVQITYDENDNMVTYGKREYIWSGKKLIGLSLENGTDVSYEYNEQGMRNGKTVNGEYTQYVLNGSKIVGEYNDAHELLYIYDSEGILIGVVIDKEEFFYELNFFGDVISLIDSYGNRVVEYEYDAFGNVTDIQGDIELAKINPFRYRGYYYDEESQMYYLNNRYYDSAIRRFICSDTIYENTQMIAFRNGFSYCANNPIKNVDYTGNWVASIGVQGDGSFYVVGGAFQFGLSIDQNYDVAVELTLGGGIQIGSAGLGIGIYLCIYPSFMSYADKEGLAINIGAGLDLVCFATAGGLSVSPSSGAMSLYIQATYGVSLSVNFSVGVTVSNTWQWYLGNVTVLLNNMNVGTKLTFVKKGQTLYVEKTASSFIKVYSTKGEGMYILFNLRTKKITGYTGIGGSAMNYGRYYYCE